MKRTRGLWLSILFVTLLIVGSIAAFATGTRPVLGLDLEGGVSVILSAPSGTGQDVMDQALENIRNRIDAFGTAEPILYVTGDTIEVQIPGLAKGTIEERPKTQYCILDESDVSYGVPGTGNGSAPGCFSDESTATTTLDGATVDSVVQSATLSGDFWGDSPPSFSTEQDAKDALAAIKVEQSPDDATKWCLTGTGLPTDPCDYASQEEAQAALDGVEVQTTNEYCVQDADGQTLASDEKTACAPTQDEAQAILDGLSMKHLTTEYCVVSSAGKNLGCLLTRDQASARLQETGQERLLQVVGETARLEEREVLQTLTPGSAGYDTAEVTCATPEEQATKACSFEALRDQQVTYYGKDGQTKYVLGPVEITGDAFTKATAVYNTGGSQSVGTGWQIDFQLNGEGASTFGEATTRLVGKQLAIVVDREIISAPTVQGAITGGNGVITGSFTKARAQDLATQLNAGALPVELKTEQVLTVSPTLGQESLHEGIIAGLVGLILLMLYLLFYYRILALVAWAGMAIWALLAFAIIALAGNTVGYSLTLAGVAGLVISLGVTADSYIVFFERFKDEVHGGKSPRAAVQPAFKRSFRTIVAADIVTALAAVVLYLTAISSVRGFALTLGVSVLLDLFVVYFFKRPAVYLIARNERLVTMPVIGLTSGVAVDTNAAPAIAGGAK
jgi:preprotein translocase subunit SecD